MNKHSTVKFLIGLVLLALLIALGYFAWPKFVAKENQGEDKVFCTMEAKLCPDGSYVGRSGPKCEFAACPNTAARLEYKNNEYGFGISLPDTWAAYTTTTEKWSGEAVNAKAGSAPYATGPILIIHSPKWTGPNTYQDIPIMIFTLSQWNELLGEKFHIGAAPIPPSELGRNSKYVFALPARYNYAFPPGYEEVDRILQSGSFRVF